VNGEPLRYRRATAALARDLGEDVLVAVRDSFYTLAGTASAVWRALEEPRGVDELSRTLAAAYGAVPERVARDVGALLSELSARGVVESVRGSDE
jgi:hypothetical protein